MKNAQKIQVEKSIHMLALERALGFKKVKGGQHMIEAVKRKLRSMSGEFTPTDMEDIKLAELIDDLRLIIEYHEIMQLPDEDLVREPLDDASLEAIVRASTTDV